MPFDPPTTEAEAQAIVDTCQEQANQTNPNDAGEVKELCDMLCEAKLLLCPDYPAQCEAIMGMISQWGCTCSS